MPQRKPLKLFVSYSHKDVGESWFALVEQHLQALVQQRVIEAFVDRKIDAGVEWDAALRIELQRCDVILLLITPAFLGSTYINEVELIVAMRKMRAGGRVIPLLCRTCDWKALEIGRLQVLPRSGAGGVQALNVTPDPDSVLAEVSALLRRWWVAQEGPTPPDEDLPQLSGVHYLSRMAKAGTLPRPWESTKLLRELMRALSTRIRRHAALVGPAGVGKKSLVDQLAFHKRVVRLTGDPSTALDALAASEGFVAIHLKNLELQTQTAVEQLRAILRRVAEHEHVHLILALTAEEYAQARAVVDDSCHVIRVTEPPQQEAVEIARLFCSRRGPVYDDLAIQLAVRLSKEQFPGAVLPGKAIELLDRAAAYADHPSTGNFSDGKVTERVVRVIAETPEQALRGH